MSLSSSEITSFGPSSGSSDPYVRGEGIEAMVMNRKEEVIEEKR
jgi:hypothetical protein